MADFMNFAVAFWILRIDDKNSPTAMKTIKKARKNNVFTSCKISLRQAKIRQLFSLPSNPISPANASD